MLMYLLKGRANSNISIPSDTHSGKRNQPTCPNVHGFPMCASKLKPV